MEEREERIGKQIYYAVRDNIYIIIYSLGITCLFFYIMKMKLSGEWSVPIDDTYIHFQYARSIAEGHPFSYHQGDGYSTGSTSPLYALLLSLPYALGIKGEALIPFTLVLGGVWLAGSMILIKRLGSRVGHELGGKAAAYIWGSWGYVWFCFYSGMETGLYIFTMLLTANLCVTSNPAERNTTDIPWGLTVSAGLLPLIRPEGLFLLFVLIITLLITNGGYRRTYNNLIRLSCSLIPTASYFGVNKLLTGTFFTAGMSSKSLLQAPYLEPAEKVVQFILQLLENSKDFLYGPETLYLTFFLSVIGLFTIASLPFLKTQEKRTALIALLLPLWLVTTLIAASLHFIRIAQWQRYYLPFFLIVILGAGFALGWMSRKFGKKGMMVTASAVIIFFQGYSTQRWLKNYEKEIAVTHDKQGAAAKAVKKLPEFSRVLVCDAGAISYLSNKWTFDIVGLTTPLKFNYFRNGVGSRFELYERIPKEKRPTHLAAYDFCLWPGIRDRVLSSHYDLIVAELKEEEAGSGEKPYCDIPQGMQLRDSVDVADLQSEDEHGYAIDHVDTSTFRAKGVFQHLDRMEERRADNLLRRGYLEKEGKKIRIADGGRSIRGTEKFLLFGKEGKRGLLIGRFSLEKDQEITLQFNLKKEKIKLSKTPLQGWSEIKLAIPAEEIQAKNKVEVHAIQKFIYVSYHYFLEQEP